MGAYDATSADQIDDRYINKGPAITKLMNKNAVEVEPAAESAMTSWIILLFSTDMCECFDCGIRTSEGRWILERTNPIRDEKNDRNNRIYQLTVIQTSYIFIAKQ